MNVERIMKSKTNRFYSFKNGIYVPDYSDPHTGTFIRGVRTWKHLDYEFDFKTSKTDKLQEQLPVEYLNGNSSSWERLRNDIHISLTPSFGCDGVYVCGKSNYFPLIFKLNMICDNILKDINGKYSNDNFKLNHTIYYHDWTKDDYIQIWQNLLTPRYLNVVNSKYTFQEYVPYRDSYFCFKGDTLQKKELINWEDLNNDNN